MKQPYTHQALEAKWQAIWQAQAVFKTPEITADQPKAYVLDMFPYPSGAGLHVGHLLGYTGSDVMARVARKKGQAVLHPMGWDAFGLPAENFAIKSGVNPAVSTAANIQNFVRQFKSIGISYDWEKEINTSEPEYYRWTQWLFQLLHKRGLAYRKTGPVNWCPKDQTVLANEQVVGGVCERCGTTVVQREMQQWYFRITDYAERLLEGLDNLDWPEKIKGMQRNWIGRSEGAYIQFPVAEQQIKVFTTRPDTLEGVTFLVLAPEHPLVEQLTSDKERSKVMAYKQQAAKSSELERTFTDRPKTGVWTGSVARNPVNGEELPIWIADYVLNSYGTGAIMAVPAYDERDRAFAQAYDLPIKDVTLPDAAGTAQLLEKAGGERTITYRLRDWLVSRQRYWGVPIPVWYDENGQELLVPEAQLPVQLPADVEFRPTGQSPLALATQWNTVFDPETGEYYHREVDTLDTFVCSSWYYLRYPTPHLDATAFDQEAVANWLPVDIYVGGAEHAVLHLLYARFITKVLFDEGLINFEEPFRSLRNQGMILGPDHQKMSKSRGNVVNPDEVIAQYGADTLRAYELFMAPFDSEKPWSTSSIVGVRRFLERVWNLQERVGDEPASELELKEINKLIARVSEAIESSKFNVAIAAMMEALNGLQEQASLNRVTYQQFLNLLNPFAPHITEELWQNMGGSGYCALAAWPEFETSYLVAESVEYVVQINGKVRQKFRVSADTSDVEVLVKAKADPVVQKYIGALPIQREIVISGKLVSLVV